MTLKTVFIQARETSTRTITAVLLSLAFMATVSAQPASLAIGNGAVCSGSSVLVPVTGTNLANVGAITLYIAYDNAALSFVSIENIDPQLSGLMFNELSSPSRISVVWSKTSGASFTNSVLFNLKFTVLQNPSALSFIRDNCEVANIALPPQVLTVTYTDGSVFSSQPEIASGPADATVPSQSNASFSVSSPNATGFAWQETRTGGLLWYDLADNATYSGSSSAALTVRNVPVSFNNFRYRCVLKLNACVATSASALLRVDSVSGTGEGRIMNAMFLKCSPNPFGNFLSIDYFVPEAGSVEIQIISLTGDILATPVRDFRPAGTWRQTYNFVSLPQGPVVCRYSLTSHGTTCSKQIKLIRNQQN